MPKLSINEYNVNGYFENFANCLYNTSLFPGFFIKLLVWWSHLVQQSIIKLL